MGSFAAQQYVLEQSNDIEGLILSGSGALRPASFVSFLAAAPPLSDPSNLAKIRSDLPVYIFSGSEDPVGQQLEGVGILVQRYREAGRYDISHDFYRGGRHEMLNEINRGEVLANLLNWLCAQLARYGR